MATVACPGCGLPRAESELGTKECPVCHAAPSATGAAPPRRAKPGHADPTDGLPADASELGARRADPRSRALVVGAAMFFFGALAGIGGVIVFQAFDTDKPKPDGNPTEVARKPDEPNPQPAEPAKPKPAGPEVAPLPHEPGAKPDPEPDPEPDPKLLLPPPPPGRVTIIDLGPNPLDTFAVPFPMKKGEHVILKGKVKAFKVPTLDAGAVLDASGLEATTVTAIGKIDGHSTLKLNAPNGTVHISGKVDGKSVVEINAPGGEVKFMYATTGTKEGSKIDNGSTVSITARVVEFKGDITGTGTKVSVVLTRNAWIKVASVSGKAAVEYKSQAAGWSAPDVIVGSVAPTAAFLKKE